MCPIHGEKRNLMKYVVDTNIFNRLIDGLLSTGELPSDGEFVATHVQKDELNRTSDANRRGMLLLKFSKVVDVVVPTESAVFDISRFDQSRFSDGRLYQSIKTDLDCKNKGKTNNPQDALIAEVAIANRWTLLTVDDDLAIVAETHGCAVRLFK